MDRIDLRILRLLQERYRLSGRIGEIKRRHGAVVYVPERERDLLARVTRLSKGRPSARAVAAFYREIFSSSRAAQGQAPIGLLASSAARVMLPARWCFGACDDFLVYKKWSEMAAGLQTGSLSLALLTGDELAAALQPMRARQMFSERLAVTGDIPSILAANVPLDERIFIATPGGNGAPVTVNRILILIECKSTVNALNSLLNFMPDCAIHAEHLTRRSRSPHGGTASTLVRLSLARPSDGIKTTSFLLAACKSAGIAVSILGIYPGTEDYGG